MNRHAWKTRSMELIGPQEVITRQIRRKETRQLVKARLAMTRQGEHEEKFDQLADRVQARRKAGKRRVQWPSWWKNAPTGAL